MKFFIHQKKWVYVLILTLHIPLLYTKPKEIYLQLINAIKTNDVVKTTYLLKKMNPNNRLFKKNNQYHMSILNLAIQYGNPKIIALIIKKGTHLNSKDRYYNTPLINATIKNDNTTMTILLEKGVNPNQKGHRHRTALHIATIKKNIIGVKLLLLYNAQPNIFDDLGNTPLYYAKKTKYPNKQTAAIIILLKKYGAQTDIINFPKH